MTPEPLPLRSLKGMEESASTGLNSNSPHRTNFNFTFSGKLSELSKGNINNAKVLLLSLIRESLRETGIRLNLSIQLESTLYPINPEGIGDFKAGAKVLLSDCRNLENITERSTSYTTDIAVFDESFSQWNTCSIGIALNQSITPVRINCYLDFENLARELVLSCDSLLEAKSPNARLSDLVRKAVTESIQLHQESTSALTAAWLGLFNTPPDLNKSYFSNGGDSIQAIRLIARLRTSGWTGDFGSLLSAGRISEWSLKQSGTSGTGTNGIGPYPLTWMQEKIWSQGVINRGRGIYHEQFVFRFENIKDGAVAERAFGKLWNSTPSIRKIIRKIDGEWMQELTDAPPDFRWITENTSMEDQLRADLEEEFTSVLMRCTFWMEDHSGYLLWSHHHVLLDGWSVGLLINRFIRLMDESEGNIEVSDHQRLFFEREHAAFGIQLKDWQEFFTIHQPQRFGPSGVRSFVFDEVGCHLPRTEADRFCQQQGITLQQFFLAVFAIANHAISGQSSVYIHGISSGRSLIPEFAETAVGLFIRTVMLGWNWRVENTGMEIIRSVIEGQSLALKTEACNPQELWDLPAEIPDTLFVFENYPYEELTGSATRGSLVFNREWTGYPVTLLVMPGKDINLKIVFDTGRFTRTFAEWIADKLKWTMNWLISSAEQPISTIATAAPAIRFTQSTFPLWWQVIDQTLRESAAVIVNGNNDNRIPVCDIPSFGTEVRTALSIYPDGSRVAVWGTRNEYTPALIYALIRSGFVYVPLNPSWPKDRIQRVLALSDCVAILADKIPAESFSIPVISIASMQESADDDKDLPILTPDSEAYILFTSGSTGDPKGISITHRNLSAFLDACQQICDNDSYSHLFALTNLGFDLSIFEMLYGLYCGKDIVTIPDMENLEQILFKFPGGLLNTVPSVLARLQPEEIAGLRVVYTAGEPLEHQTWKHLHEHNPNLIIRNWYGPAETTTYSTCADLTKSFRPDVGNALPHEAVEIRDHQLLPVPDGIEGEVVIAGEGVATGYINLSGDTSFTCINTNRVYRTGDRGRMKDGLLYLNGRQDRQVKRLGQRFEPEEVERAILQTFVTVRRVHFATDGGKHLVFVESETESASALSDYLTRTFPVYMHPDKLVILPRFPENPNGKMDRQQLLETFDQTPSNDGDFTQHPLLRRLKNIRLFSSLREHHGFIEQGGDSILALRLTGKLKSWGYTAEVGKLLSAPTLLAFLEDLETADTIQVPSEDALPLTPIQDWFYREYTGNRNHFNQSVLLEILADLPSTVLMNGLQQTVESFPILSMIYADGWKPGLAPEIENVRFRHENELTQWCEARQKSLNLETGPVGCFAVMETDTSKYLFAVIHHFYCDGFSWRIFLDTLRSSISGEIQHHPSFETFASVRATVTKLGIRLRRQHHQFFGESILNPFKEQSVPTYEDSIYREWVWDRELTSSFTTTWWPGKAVNEKFVYLVLGGWLEAGLPPITPFLETHGRGHEDVDDLSDSMGWYTQFYPVFTRRFPDKTNLAKQITEEFSNLPAGGMTYMAQQDWRKPPYPLLLNFLGNFDEDWGGMARPTAISQGTMVAAGNTMLAMVEINAMIVNGEMRWMLRSSRSFDQLAFQVAFSEFAGCNLRSDSIKQSNDHGFIDASDQDAIDKLLGIA